MDGEQRDDDGLTAHDREVLFFAGELERHSDVIASLQAQVSVWAGAVYALAHTHPDPSAFAAAFRRFWRKAGDQHSNSAVLASAQTGYAEALSDLERVCRVPLGVRPPGVAEPPAEG